MAETQDWITVGALGEAFAPGANLLAQSRGLADRTLTLHLEDGSVIELRFSGSTTLTWTVHGDHAPGRAQLRTEVVAFSVTEIRSGVFFVDFIDPGKRAGTATFVLDTQRQLCTAVFGELPTAEEARRPLIERIAGGHELTSVTARFLRGAIDTPFIAGPETHIATSELIGQRIEYTYSATERYEHVYLNDRFYSWHCLAGSERGLADTDRCHYVKLAPLLYLFVWREKLVPTLGVVVIDLEQLKTTGKILGYRDFDFGAVTNFPVGARVRLVNRT